VAISFDKKVSLKILRRISFQVLGGQSGPLGADGPRVFEFFI
jgi:hypothetical protein